MIDRDKAREMVDYLNVMLSQDREATTALAANVVPCNYTMADGCMVQCHGGKGSYYAGLLGVLNGMCGPAFAGNNIKGWYVPIVAVYEEDVCGGRRLQEFKLADEPAVGRPPEDTSRSQA